MVCIFCHKKTTVINSRTTPKHPTVWRRRKCLNCKAVFTSRETADYSGSIRVKLSASSLEPFLRDRLFVSILRSLSHRKTALTDAHGLTDTVIRKLLLLPHQGLVDKTEIISMTLETLKLFDQAAYTHFKVHHSS